MKRITGEGEPVIVVPLVVKPIEIGLALRLVPPDVHNVLLAPEGIVPSAAYATVH